MDMTFQTWNSGAIDVVAPRHAVVAHDELRQEGEEETDEDDQRGQPATTIRSTCGRSSSATSSAARPCRPCTMPPTMMKWKWAMTK